MAKARPVGSKLCATCGESKPLEDFYPHSKPGLYQSSCKRCHCALSVERFSRLPADQQYAAQFKRRLKKYGLTPASYEERLVAQGRRCAICGTNEPDGRANHAGVARFTVDHDHATGAVRGLLCVECNRGLGAFDDDPERLALAIAYLVGKKE